MARARRSVLTIALAALAACATTDGSAVEPRPASGPPAPRATPAAPRPASGPAPTGGDVAPASTPWPELTVQLAGGTVALRRAALARFVAQGAGHFNALIDVRPAFRRGRFFGWHVSAYRGPGQLAPGDIVLGVNGRSLERPEQFMAVWDGLARGKALVVDLERRGRRATFRYPIVDR